MAGVYLVSRNADRSLLGSLDGCKEVGFLGFSFAFLHFFVFFLFRVSGLGWG